MCRTWHPKGVLRTVQGCPGTGWHTLASWGKTWRCSQCTGSQAWLPWEAFGAKQTCQPRTPPSLQETLSRRIRLFLTSRQLRGALALPDQVPAASALPCPAGWKSSAKFRRGQQARDGAAHALPPTALHNSMSWQQTAARRWAPGDRERKGAPESPLPFARGLTALMGAAPPPKKIWCPPCRSLSLSILAGLCPPNSWSKYLTLWVALCCAIVYTSVPCYPLVPCSKTSHELKKICR